MEEILSAAKLWLSLDKDPITHQQIQTLVDIQDYNQLSLLLSTRLTFGTAGLRAQIPAGFNRINCLTVIQTTQGLFKYLQSVFPNLSVSGVVIGYDHRHRSLDFAKLTAAVFLSKNVPVYIFRNCTHTPLVPFAISHFKACSGIMITASHNPKTDNGYKLYWSNASQIIPPHDSAIASCILENLIPWTWDFDLAFNSPLSIDPKECIPAYYSRIKLLSANPTVSCSLKFCYTPMHGVGYEYASTAFKTFNLDSFIPVKEQMYPDPDFPTVAYPNPEEGKGALKLAIKTADENNCSIILANDPDADRLAIAEKLGDSWYIFNGNEIGAILGKIMLSKYINSGFDLKKIAMISSTVSSRILETMAKFHGFHFEETLTGFKWMGNKAIDLELDGYKVVFAFEEAIGFMIENIVYDKDGISAMVVVAEHCKTLYSSNCTLFDYLQSIYQTYGYFVSNNGYFICHSTDTINKIFDEIRYGNNKDTFNYPKSLGQLTIVAIRDLTASYDSEQPNNVPILPVSKSSQMLTFKFSNESVITLRTSGTEPKIKWYSEIKSKSMEHGRNDLKLEIDDMIREWLEPVKNNLIPQEN